MAKANNTAHVSAVPAPADLEPVTITTNRRHLLTLRTAMLRDLEELLKGATESVHDMAEVSSDWTPGVHVPVHVRAHDARSHVEWIKEAIDTLDDLGWAREAEWDGYRA